MDYSTLTNQEPIELLKRRDSQTPLGIVWERNKIDHDRALNNDFIAMSVHRNYLQVTPHRPIFLLKVITSTRCGIYA